MARELLSATHPHLFDEIVKSCSYDFNVEKITNGSQKFVIWESKDCEHTFEMSIINRVRSRTNCPYCCGQRVLPGFNDLQTLFPDLIDEWDFERNLVQPSELTAFSHKTAYWSCTEGHQWEAPIYSRAKHNNGCGICSNRIIVDGVNDPLSLDTLNVRSEWSARNGLSIEEAAKNSIYESFLWNCINCSTEWSAVLVKRFRGFFRCPSCFSKSHLEGTVATFLHKMKIPFQWNKKPLRVSESGKENLQIDFMLVEYPLGFEVQDFATHSKGSDSEETSLDYWKIKKKKGPSYHELKRELASSQLGLKLVDIWEDDVLTGKYEEIILKEIEDSKNG